MDVDKVQRRKFLVRRVMIDLEDGSVAKFRRVVRGTKTVGGTAIHEHDQVFIRWKFGGQLAIARQEIKGLGHVIVQSNIDRLANFSERPG